ncbi:MAG TPA: TlpA disulfide reductase family protein [Jatrophihabitans sp.]|nr:TlpA disulfide reductase family protein [Jatrophihabitans sp.]
MIAPLLLAVALVAGCTGGKNAVDQSAGGQFRYQSATARGNLIPVADRKSAGDVSGPLLSGGQFQLSQDKGKVILFNFFASWCAPCQAESPQLDALYQQRKANGFQVVGLDVKDPNKGQLSSFVANKKLTYPIVIDQAARTAIELGNVPLAGLPASVLIDKQGRVAAVYVGQVFPKDLDPVLDQLASET